MDVPVGLVTWEVFLPQQYRVAEFGGDAIPARVLPVAHHEAERVGAVFQDVGSFAPKLLSLAAGQIGGYVVDPSDAIVPNVKVTVTLPNGATRTASSDTSGRWMLLGVPSGHLRIRADAPGFKAFVREVDYDSSQPGHFTFRLEVGSVSETITVMSNNASMNRESQQIERNMRQNAAMPEAASANVTALQNRVVGVLPIAVNVPKAGNSYRFVRPLLVNEETRVTFRYRAARGEGK
ncbi:MAG TPA: carboxypeptidase-like regulatory domain-containing protein [Candidatus Solibacter sp.]|nr:carboxypeptidase-like regulatory domain-containing protein [Candidatus Solibacter sp.]